VDANYRHRKDRIKRTTVTTVMAEELANIGYSAFMLV